MQQQITVTLNQTTPIICTSCMGQLFEEGLFLRKVSRFITGNSQDSVMPVPVLMCKGCGALCADALAPELRDMLLSDSETLTEE